ncbi:MAG: helix-turn-helix domain-containing protein [Candidatus Micrarchaeaceae archaeon]
MTAELHINFEMHKITIIIVMKTAYKYRAYPSKEQKAKLGRQMFLAKELYNLLLEKSKAYYKEAEKMLTDYRMNVWLTQIKKEKPEFAELYSQVLQNVSKMVSDVYKHFFRRPSCKIDRRIVLGQFHTASAIQS